jgi:hypothetical protein
MSSYPSGIYDPRSKENAYGIVYDPNKLTVVFAEDITGLDSEVVALETELGLNPKNTSLSVAERIKGIRSLSNSNSDVIVIKQGHVGIGQTSPAQKFEVIGSNADVNYAGSFILLNDSPDVPYATAALYILNETNYGSGLRNSIYCADSNPSYFSGSIGISVQNPIISSGKGLHISGKLLRIDTDKTPSSSVDTGNKGELCWDSDYLYVCVATNTWKRISLLTF